jgi:hypothetical protein
VKKYILFFLVFSSVGFPCWSRGLSSIPGIHDQKADQSAYMLSAGYFQGNFNLLNNYLVKFKSSRGFSPFFTTVGIDWVLPAGGRHGEHNASFPNLEFILPQQISGDSAKFRMIGWHLITSLWSYDVLKENKKLALDIAPGMDWGQLYIRETSGFGKLNYHNPFIAPLARMEFRVVLPPLAFGVRASYRYDISSPRWKDEHNDSALAYSRISGMGFQLFFGWGKISK